jgi:hypothetical protein
MPNVASISERHLVAHAYVQATIDHLPQLRKDPGQLPGNPLPSKFLRHADGQTVVGLAAVLKAIRDFALQDEPFTAWSVLAASRFMGRAQFAAALNGYRQNGPKMVSPHIIPQASLHSLSGAISVALKIRGPNLGVGGGQAALSEGLLAALTSVEVASAPGAWLVLTEWDPEPTPDTSGRSTCDASVHAVAMALTRHDSRDSSLLLRLVAQSPPATEDRTGGSSSVADVSPSVHDLGKHVAQLGRGQAFAAWSCRLPGDLQVEIDDAAQQKTGSVRHVA